MKAKSNSPPRERSLGLLILEDNPLDAKLAVAILERAGYSLSSEILDSPEQFQEALERADYDLILADYNLRDWTAMDALETLKHSAKDIPFVVVTGSLGDEAAVECIKQGASDYVLKHRLERLPVVVDRTLRDRARRKEAARLEELISRGKKQWELTFDTVPDPIFVIDELGGVQRANRAAAALFGSQPAQLIGRPCCEAVHGQAEVVPDCPHQRLLTSGREESGDVEVPRLRRTFHATASPIHDPTGHLRGCVHVMRDITERKQAEEALAASQASYRSLILGATYGIFRCSPDGKFLTVNPALVTMLGYGSEAELLTVNLVSDISQDAEAGAQLLDQYRRTGRIDGLEAQWKRKDGTFLPVRLSGRAVMDGEDALQGFEVIAENVTERKRAEDALRASEERFRELVENANDAIYTVDLEGNLTSFNKAGERVSGYTREEALKMNLAQLLAPEDVVPVRQAMTRLAAGETIGVLELDLLAKGGDRVSLEVNPRPVWQGGKVVCVQGIARDVTERRRAEVELRQSAHLLKEACELGRLGWWEYDMEARKTGWSETVYSLFERDPSLGPPSLEVEAGFYFPEDARRLQEARRRALEQAEPYKLDVGVRLPSGKHTHFHIIGSPFRDASGRVTKLTGTMQDITERKEMEEALEASEEKNRALLESAAEGILVADDETRRFLHANPAACRMLGYSKEELLRLHLDDIHSPEDLPLVRAEFEAQERGDKAVSAEIPCLRKDGTKIYTNISTAKTVIAGRPCTMGLFSDVTDRKRMEEQLRQSQKLEAIGRLAGGIAHDFNNLLTIINGYSQLLLSRAELADPLHGFLSEILKAGERAASLTRQLLTFSRHQVVTPQVLDLNAVITNMHKMLRRLIGEDIDLVTTLGSDLGRVKVDRGQIEQVVLNLSLNARDAMPHGGKLTLETANVELDEAYARRHMAATPGRYVMLAASDTGVGMDAETQAHAFEPFYTTKEQGKGTGLGLSTVYGVVKQSGGHIWVYSEPGLGTTFKIYLPLVEEAVAASGGKQVRPTSMRGTETILMVEDDEAVRPLVRAVLRSHGYNVLEASQGEEALAACQHHTGPVHLLLTDMVMPGMSGSELAKRVASLYPGMKTLYMSGYTDGGIAHRGALDADAAFIQKPFTPDALAAKVRETLDSVHSLHS